MKLPEQFRWMPIAEIPGAVSITIVVRSPFYLSYTFELDSTELNSRRNDPLSAANSDFIVMANDEHKASDEYFDVFYSDRDGSFNPAGQFLTIEAVYPDGSDVRGGLNIAEVALNFDDGRVAQFDHLASWVGLGGNHRPGTVQNAVDGTFASFSWMGNTAETAERLRLTIGFEINAQPGEVLPGSPENTRPLSPAANPPTARPIEECSVFRLEVDLSGGGGGLGYLFQRGSHVPSCLEDYVAEGTQECGRHPNWQVGADLYDDCMVWGWFNIRPDLELKFPLPRGSLLPHTRLRPHGTLEDVYYGGIYYFDQNCEQADPAAAEIADSCDSGFFGWVVSPVSLILEEGHDIDAEAVTARFPLDPREAGSWYVWKASEKAPLLVYDPHHTNRVVSAYQLFGEWTFGGQPLAGLADMRDPQPWEHGFQALATLDLDGDGVISGEELEPLALWFDANRDGVSQEGEVRRLSDVGITALYYKPDYRDETTGSIYVYRGFEREVGGQTITGPAVDWYGDRLDAPFDLIARQLGKRDICAGSWPSGLPPADAAARAAGGDVPGGSSSEESASQAPLPQESVTGLWRWRSLHVGFPGAARPEGFFILRETAEGELRGYSLVETRFDAERDGLGGMIQVIPLRGTMETGGAAEISFTVAADGGTIVTNRAVLAPGASRMTGRSEAVVPYNGTAVRISYEWEAVRQ